MATNTRRSNRESISQCNRSVTAWFGVSLFTYKSIKATTQLAGVAAGFYAIAEGADPMTTFVIIGLIVSGPEMMEYLIDTDPGGEASDGRGLLVLGTLVPRSSDESETARDGFLSTRREIHASVVGLAVGVTVALTGSLELAGLFVFSVLGAKLGSKHLGDLRREPWYALGAFLAGLAGTQGLQTVATVALEAV
jgi:hypothetical protein